MFEDLTSEELKRRANAPLPEMFLASCASETSSQVVELSGDERLRSVGIRDGQGRLTERSIGGLFVMIGAAPCTGWLRDTLRLDDRGFVLMGEACGADAATPFNVFQTDLPGVFAVGARRIHRRRGLGRCSGNPRPAGRATTGRSIRTGTL